MPMSPDDLKYFNEKFERLENKLEDKVDVRVRQDTCKAIRQSCAEKIELKLKNLKMWTLAVLASCGLNIGSFIYNLTGTEKPKAEPPKPASTDDTKKVENK